MVVSLPSFLLACACHIPGVISSADSSTCDNATGQCFCKTLVTGRACDTCVDTHWNLSPSNEAGCEGIEHWRFILCLLSYWWTIVKYAIYLTRPRWKSLQDRWGSLKICKDPPRSLKICKDPTKILNNKDLLKILWRSWQRYLQRPF